MVCDPLPEVFIDVLSEWKKIPGSLANLGYSMQKCIE
jgi:hypothetical protein